MKSTASANVVRPSAFKHDAQEAVFDGTITLVAVQRTVIEPRIAAKVTSLQAARAAA
jgi:hypothetical protein